MKKLSSHLQAQTGRIALATGARMRNATTSIRRKPGPSGPRRISGRRAAAFRATRRNSVETLESRRLLAVNLALEDVGSELAEESYWNGPVAGGEVGEGPFGDTVVEGRWRSGGLSFNNVHSLDFGSWNGWAYSNTTDDSTPGYENQHSAVTGGGVAGSRTYAVAYQDTSGEFPPPSIALTEATADQQFSSVTVTNTTTAALSMLEGDSFARRFGWLDANADGDFDDASDFRGDYPDWFLLTIEGIDDGGESTGLVEFYLADYRFVDDSRDYVVTEWIDVDLSSLSDARSLRFELSSSDIGDFGMNTPAYFALDRADVGLEGLGAALPEGGFWAGPDPEGSEQQGAFGDTVVAGAFRSGPLRFDNIHSLDFGSWVGWSYSNVVDTTTPGYTNQYAAFPGAGAGESDTYGVAFQDVSGFFPPPTVSLDPSMEDYRFQSLQVANTTTAALSMLQGDEFARRFGWLDANGDGDFDDAGDHAGDHPDWLLLTIDGIDALGNDVGSVDFHLADFRGDEASDHVVDQWTEVDLTSLVGAVQLRFRLSSSDEGPFGINTPAYFAVDDIRLARATDEIPPQVVSVELNGMLPDPDDLPGRKQPTGWRDQRSMLQSIDVTFSEPMDWDSVSVNNVDLLNLGLDAPNETDRYVTLEAHHLQPLDDTTLRIRFLVGDQEPLPLRDGVYELVLHPSITDRAGNTLLGDPADAGLPFVYSGDADNRFYQLTGDWNGDLGVSVFDFMSLAYWFGRPIPEAPTYMDLNRDAGVSILDFTLFAAAYGNHPTLPPPGVATDSSARFGDSSSGSDDVARAERGTLSTRERTARSDSSHSAALLAVLADWSRATGRSRPPSGGFA